MRQDLGDFDGDEIPNHLDPDDDNDGVTDENDADPLNPTIWDESQIPDPENPVSNPNPTVPPKSNDDDISDFDGDEIPDHLDPDDDNDGVTDEEDADPFNPNIQNQSQFPTAVPVVTPTAVPALTPTPAPTQVVPESPTEVPTAVPAAPGEAPAQPEPQAETAVPKVAALPETGSGTSVVWTSGLVASAAAILAIGTLFFVSQFSHRIRK